MRAWDPLLLPVPSSRIIRIPPLHEDAKGTVRHSHKAPIRSWHWSVSVTAPRRYAGKEFPVVLPRPSSVAVRVGYQ